MVTFLASLKSLTASVVDAAADALDADVTVRLCWACAANCCPWCHCHLHSVTTAPLDSVLPGFHSSLWRGCPSLTTERLLL